MIESQPAAATSLKARMIGAGAFAAVAALLPLAALASSSGAIVIGPQAMEGDLHVNPGDTLKAGYDFTIPGGHPAETVEVVNTSVTFLLTCPNGSDASLTITLPDSTFQVPANNSSWYPSGDQSSALTYQGSTGPLDRCNGSVMRDQQGARFGATFRSSDTVDSVHVRFHYVDFMQNNSSSWSATAAVSPATIPNAPPPGCSNGQVVNSSGQCVTPASGCTSGQVMNSNGQCVTPASGCTSGQVMNSNGQCVTPASGCSNGQVMSSSGQCVAASTSQPIAAAVQGISAPTPIVGANVPIGVSFLLICLGCAALVVRYMLRVSSLREALPSEASGGWLLRLIAH
jgi:hypothetical protein